MFIQHLATTTHNVVKTERKPRRNIQYRDISSAVAKTDNLEFLVDVVPKTVTYKEFKKRKEESDKVKAEAEEARKKAKESLRTVRSILRPFGRSLAWEGLNELIVGKCIAYGCGVDFMVHFADA